MRFSLKWFFLVMGLFAVLIAAMVYQTATMKTASTFMVWGSMVVAAIAAVMGGVKQRPFSAGYAISGLAVLVVLIPPRQVFCLAAWAGWSPFRCGHAIKTLQATPGS